MPVFDRMITTIDAHTAGEPFRVVSSGLPPIPGATILEKRRAMIERFDHLRTFLMLEPRGHAGMYGGIVTEPTSPGADLGVLFLHNEGYSTMCGHGVIALTKVALEYNLVAATGQDQVINIDAPCGRIVAQGFFNDGRVTKVEFENVPSFVFAKDIEIDVDGIGPVRADIAYGGAFYVYIPADRLGLTVVPDNVERLVQVGMEIKRKAMAKYPVSHPADPDLGFIYGTIITEGYQQTDRGIESKNICIFADGQIDRSPTGSGTSGRLALMAEAGIIQPGQTFINKSIIETEFSGLVLGPAQVGDKPAVRTLVGGTAQVMGFNQLVLEPDDPLPEGFRLGGG